MQKSNNFYGLNNIGETKEKNAKNRGEGLLLKGPNELIIKRLKT